MSYSSNPPPYSDVSPLILQQPDEYPQPPPYPGGYPQPAPYPGGHPQPRGHPQPAPYPGGHPQPGGYPGGYPPPAPYAGGYPQPGRYAGGYPQPGGYASPGGYPYPAGPVPPMAALPMDLGDAGLPAGGCDVVTVLGDNVVWAVDWDNRRVRHAFIRKVYTIISLQLLVTVAIIAVFTFISPVRSFVQWNVTVYYASYAMFLVTYLVLACCQGPRRRFPWNIILLSIFTLAMSFMAGTIASTYDTKAVLIAMGITAAVAVTVTIFCLQYEVDFISCTGLFCVLGIVLILTSLVTLIVLHYQYIHWVHMVFAAIVAIAFTLFLAYDTQLLVGNRQYALSPEEYVFGAVEIYADIVYIFLFLLRCVGCK